MVKPPERRDHVQSLERGLAVILAFSAHRPRLSLAEIAEHTGLTRPTVRRILITLQDLGYIRAVGREFALTPHVLSLGNAYLSSLNLTEVAQPYMEDLTATTGHTCSLSALDGEDAVFLARVPARRVMSITLTTGTRLPAYATSMGRVLLAGLPRVELDAFLASAKFCLITPHTVIDAAELRARIDRVREQGWALVDQELEEGVRSFAAPVCDATGAVIAALAMSCSPSVAGLEQIHQDYLPAVVRTAGCISEQLGAPARHAAPH